MPGSLYLQERGAAGQVLVSSGSALTNGSAALAGVNLDCRATATGSGAAPNDLFSQMQLECQWATITGIAARAVVAEIHFVPSLDGGTTWPTVDTTAGASQLQTATISGHFEVPMIPTANVNQVLVSRVFDLMPWLYRVYLVNRSLQTITAGWKLTVGTVAGRYT